MRRNSLTDADLERKANKLRKRLLQAIVGAGAGQAGGGLSCLDILNVLYNRVLRVSPETFPDLHRDRYVQSKGHSVEALYTVLADRGFFPESDLDTICRYQSHYVGHLDQRIRSRTFQLPPFVATVGVFSIAAWSHPSVDGRLPDHGARTRVWLFWRRNLAWRADAGLDLRGAHRGLLSSSPARSRSAATSTPSAAKSGIVESP